MKIGEPMFDVGRLSEASPRNESDFVSDTELRLLLMRLQASIHVTVM
jgi:hypothetical protein